MQKRYPTGLFNPSWWDEIDAEVPRTVFSQHHWSTVSMVIRRHEIYGKSRRSVSQELPSVGHSTLQRTLDIAVSRAHRKCLLKFVLVELIDVPGWTAGAPPHCRGVARWASHQTVWVILSPRRDPRWKSNDQSPALSAHRAAKRPRPLAAGHFEPLLLEKVRAIKRNLLFLFISLFIHVFFFFARREGEELVRQWRQRDATPRDCDVVHILVRKCGRRRRRPKPEESKFSRQVLPDFTAPFVECPCGFFRELLGSSKIRLKMSAIESILWTMGRQRLSARFCNPSSNEYWWGLHYGW